MLKKQPTNQSINKTNKQTNNTLILVIYATHNSTVIINILYRLEIIGLSGSSEDLKVKRGRYNIY